MRRFQRKLGSQRLFESWPVLSVLGFFVIFLSIVVFRFFGKMQETGKNKQVALAKVAELERNKERLSKDINKLGTESGIEESLREKFGLAKEGEGLIVVVEEEKEEISLEANTGGFFGFFKKIFTRN